KYKYLLIYLCIKTQQSPVRFYGKDRKTKRYETGPKGHRHASLNSKNQALSKKLNAVALNDNRVVRSNFIHYFLISLTGTVGLPLRKDRHRTGFGYSRSDQGDIRDARR